MLRLLLDTCVLLWALEDSSRLSTSTRQLIVEPKNEVFVSVASAWEMAIKRALGRFDAPENLGEELAKAKFTELQVTIAHCEQAALLPTIHRDPFDRMLVAQAQAEELTLVTPDQKIWKYDVKTMDV